MLGITLKLRDFTATAPQHGFSLLHIAGGNGTAGVPDPALAGYVLACLKRAVQGCGSGQFQGLVTGPVHKATINAGGIAFTGHTEFLAEMTDTDTVVMLLVANSLRVALLTTHLPLRQVPNAIQAADLAAKIRILDSELHKFFTKDRPRIAVTGLNPHAGEGGYLGREEIDIIAPVIKELAASGICVTGPWPADTLFTPAHLANCDVVLAMYHDQGLPVLKHAGFGTAVNVTLGLPLIRTSVDHGTALDLAGTGKADTGSLLAALELAADMAQKK